MNKRAALALQQADRFKQCTSMLMLDVDFFKRINDHHGHIEGDRVLSVLGENLTQMGRQTDLICRFGGEEFLLLLPNTNIEKAQVFASRIHKVMNEIIVGDTPITASIGLSFSQGAKTFDEMLAKADKALYTAKETGRNKTVVSD